MFLSRRQASSSPRRSCRNRSARGGRLPPPRQNAVPGTHATPARASSASARASPVSPGSRERSASAKYEPAGHARREPGRGQRRAELVALARVLDARSPRSTRDRASRGRARTPPAAAPARTRRPGRVGARTPRRAARGAAIQPMRQPVIAKRLGERVHRDRALAQPGSAAGATCVAPVEDEVLVDLVGEDPEVARARDSPTASSSARVQPCRTGSAAC